MKNGKRFVENPSSSSVMDELCTKMQWEKNSSWSSSHNTTPIIDASCPWAGPHLIVEVNRTKSDATERSPQEKKGRCCNFLLGQYPKECCECSLPSLVHNEFL